MEYWQSFVNVNQSVTWIARLAYCLYHIFARANDKVNVVFSYEVDSRFIKV
jgi:hypothetical protein